MQKDTITTITATTSTSPMLKAMATCALDMVWANWEEYKANLRERCVDEGYPSNGAVYESREEHAWETFYGEEVRELEDAVSGRSPMTRFMVEFTLSRWIDSAED